MAFAIIETGGKQYKVSDGAVLKVEKIAGAEEGKEVVFDKVLLMDDGKSVKVGTPYLEGATITATLVCEGRGKKISGIKYKAKTRYARHWGHRQAFAEIKVKNV